MKEFDKKQKEVKLGILEFFKDENASLCFTFKDSITKYLEEQNVPKKTLFSKNFKAWGKITNIASNGMLYIAFLNKEELIIPVDFVKNISWNKLEE